MLIVVFEGNLSHNFNNFYFDWQKISSVSGPEILHYHARFPFLLVEIAQPDVQDSIYRTTQGQAGPFQVGERQHQLLDGGEEVRDDVIDVDLESCDVTILKYDFKL